MTTIIRRLPVAVSGSVAIPDTNPSASEISIFRNSSVAYWWRADAGYSSGQWRCRKTGLTLTPTGAKYPARSSSVAAYNNKPALLWTVAAPLSSGVQAVFPVGGSLSFVVVGRANTGDNAVLISNAAPFGSNDMSIWYNSTSDNISARVAGTAVSAGANSISAGGNLPRILETSFNVSTRSINLRINRGAVNASNTAPSGASNANPVLRVGGGFAADGASAFANLESGEIAEIIVLTTSLADVANASLRGLVEGYLNDRYDI